LIGYNPYDPSHPPAFFSALPHYQILNGDPWPIGSTNATNIDGYEELYSDISNIKDGRPMLSQVKIGTVTYCYGTSGQDHFIERIDEFPGRRSRNIVLKNVFDFNLSTGNYLFQAIPVGGTPIQGVSISLRIQFPQLSGASYTYNTQAILRGEGWTTP